MIKKYDLHTSGPTPGPADVTAAAESILQENWP
jgi:hypothetical protein